MSEPMDELLEELDMTQEEWDDRWEHPEEFEYGSEDDFVLDED